MRLVQQIASDVGWLARGDQRDAVPAAVAVGLDVVPEGLEADGGEGGGGALEFLEREDVRALGLHPGQDPVNSGADGIHIPRHNPHGVSLLGKFPPPWVVGGDAGRCEVSDLGFPQRHQRS